MNGEIHEKPTNKTPMIYTGGDFITPYPMTKEFIRELADLYNKYGIDSKLNMRDFRVGSSWDILFNNKNVI